MSLATVAAPVGGGAVSGALISTVFFQFPFQKLALWSSSPGEGRMGT